MIIARTAWLHRFLRMLMLQFGTAIKVLFFNND